MNKIKTSKTLIIGGLVILLCLSVGGYYFYNKNKDSNNRNQTNDASLEEQGVSPDQSGASIKDENAANSNQNSEAPTATAPLPGVALSIDSFSQSNGLVKVAATVTNSGVGNCYFGFSSSDTKPVSRTIQSTAQGSVQKCTVEINEVEFTKLGAWNLNVIFTQNDAKVEKSQNVTIN